LKEEIEAAQAFLADVRKASPRARHVLVRGNHCQRVENALANKLPEFEGMLGTRLEELFPDWNRALLRYPGSVRPGTLFGHSNCLAQSQNIAGMADQTLLGRIR
jgi:hypothetical protein